MLCDYLKRRFASCLNHGDGTRGRDLEPHVWEACGPAPNPAPVLFLGSWQRLTFLAEASPIAGEAKADEGIDLIDARATVLTGAGDAIVNIWGGGGAQSEVSLPLAPSPQGNKAEDAVTTLPSTPDPRTSAVVCTDDLH